MREIFLISIFIIYFSQNQFAQSDLSKLTVPDTLILELFDSFGCEMLEYTYISINYNNGKGIIYTYNARDYYNYGLSNNLYLKRGYFNEIICDSIFNLIKYYKLDSIKNDQLNSNAQRLTTADGSGKCILYLSKANHKFSKTISYPKPLGRILNNDLFKEFYYKVNKLAIELSEDIPLEDILEIYNSSDQNIKERYITSAIQQIRDTSKIDRLIELYNSDLFVDAVFSSLSSMDSDKVIVFFESLIDKSNKVNKPDYYNQGKILYVIAQKSNDSLKIINLKRCLLINDRLWRFRAARELAILKDPTGIEILLNELDNYENGNYSETINALIKLDNKSVIDSLIIKYNRVKNNDSIPDYKKNNIISYYLLGLNRLMEIESKKDIRWPYYTNNLDQEMTDMEITIIEYQHEKKND